jgi:hypothetical protein
LSDQRYLRMVVASWKKEVVIVAARGWQEGSDGGLLVARTEWPLAIEHCKHEWIRPEKRN